MRILFVIFICVVFGAPSHADDSWTNADIGRQVAVEVLLIADWGQSRYGAQDPKQRYEEKNQWLGNHPTTQEVDRYFISWLVIHPVISHFLPSEWRKGFQSITIFVQAVTVHQNATVAGIGYRLPF